MDSQRLGAMEAMLFAHAEPVETKRLAEALYIDCDTAEQYLLALQKEYDEQERGVSLLRYEGSRWQLTTRPLYADVVRRVLYLHRNVPLSAAALEVLAIIAYNQPVSRGFIEQIRGVDSSSTVSGLLEKGLIEEAGRLDLPGRPVSFCVTDNFLRVFGLNSIQDLPPVHEEDMYAGDFAEERTDQSDLLDTSEQESLL